MTTIHFAMKKFIVGTGLALMAFLVPLKPLLLGALALVIIDMWTGIRAAKARGEEIRSRGIYRTGIKFRDYAILIIVGEVMSKMFFAELPINFSTIASMFIAYTEFRSFCENMYDVTKNDFWNKVFAIMPNFNFKGKDLKGNDPNDLTNGSNQP